MATSAIFKYANDISMNRSANSARSVTTGGYARTHRLGPSVMSFEADLPLLTEEQFREVENELFGIDDGIKFLNVNISSNNGNNIMQSTAVPLKAGETNIKLIAYSYSTTREITLTNLLPNTTNIFKIGDFLQFANFHKLYQIAKPLGSTNSIFTSSSTGTCKVRLSTPLLSSVGLPVTSIGSTDRYYIVTGSADEYEIVSYDLYGGPVRNSANNSEGIIIFKDATSGIQSTYADGTDIKLTIPLGRTTNYQINGFIGDCISGTSNDSNITAAQNLQNNKIGQVVYSKSYSGSSATGVFTFNFTTPNIRVELTDVSMIGQTLTNETVVNAFNTSYQDGSMTIKLANGNTALDSNGNPLVITIPSTQHTAEQIITYLENQIEVASSTHILKTDGVITNLTIKAFPEDYGETVLNHVGYFEITWGLDYEGCSLEYTTPTGTELVNYNPVNLTGDEVATIITNGITIENAAGTYVAGDFINTLVDAPLRANTRRIESVTTVGTTTTINFVTVQEGAVVTADTFSGGDIDRTRSNHTDVPGTSSNSLSTVGTFDIEISSVIATVDTFSAADTNRTATTHTDVYASSDNSSSTIGTFDIVVDSVGAITSVTVNTLSENVEVGDIITVNDYAMSNNGSNNFTFRIATIDEGSVISVTPNTLSKNTRVGDVITIDVADMDNNEADDVTFRVASVNHNNITDFTSTNYASKEIYKHLNDSLSTSNKVLFELNNVAASSVVVSDVNIFMGPDVNMKLMLTNKPAVTIVPKDENKNLYKYNTFKFAEVL